MSSATMHPVVVAPFDLFAKTPTAALTPEKLKEFTGRVMQRRTSASELLGHRTMPSKNVTRSTPLSPLALEQHDSLLPPQRKVVTIGDEEFDMESDHASLPSLQDAQTSYTTNETTTPARSPLQITVTTSNRQRRSGVFSPNRDINELADSPANKLTLTNSPSNWEQCSFSTPDGRKVSMLDISQDRLQGTHSTSNSSKAVDTLVEPNDGSEPHHSRPLSQLSVIVPGRDDDEYDALSDLSVSETPLDDNLVVIDPDLQDDIRREESHRSKSNHPDKKRNRTLEEENLLFQSVSDVPMPSFDKEAPEDEAKTLKLKEAPSETSSRPRLSNRQSLNASLDRSRVHVRSRLDNILANFDSHIESLMGNARTEFEELKASRLQKMGDRTAN